MAPALARNVASLTSTRVTLPGAHEAAAVAFEAGGRDGEGETTALHLDQGGLGQHDLADADGGQVVELRPAWPRSIARR